ncbi:uncharacterized protein [Castor canadensis]|uniref:Uncharacterized protein n=1 Tax=Castor canadensis TaxID=51338 RepID=A0AC58KTX6_CASCN
MPPPPPAGRAEAQGAGGARGARPVGPGTAPPPRVAAPLARPAPQGPAKETREKERSAHPGRRVSELWRPDPKKRKIEASRVRVLSDLQALEARKEFTDERVHSPRRGHPKNGSPHPGAQPLNPTPGTRRGLPPPPLPPRKSRKPSARCGAHSGKAPSRWDSGIVWCAKESLNHCADGAAPSRGSPEPGWRWQSGPQVDNAGQRPVGSGQERTVRECCRLHPALVWIPDRRDLSCLQNRKSGEVIKVPHPHACWSLSPGDG